MTPQARATDKRYYGVAAAIVSDVNDPAKEGRVQVRFPWFDPDMTSEWCRVAQLYAGAGKKGSLWVPDVNDEVVVAFVHGDMREPVVLGCIYNGKDKPPTFRNGTQDEKIIRTRAGHEILFVDTAGKEQVRIKTKGKRTVTLDDAKSTVTIETPDGMSIEMKGGTVTIKGTTSVKLDAPKVDITSAPASSVPLGEMLLTAFNTHIHTCSSPGSPSTPPVVQLVAASVLSQKVKVS